MKVLSAFVAILAVAAARVAVTPSTWTLQELEVALNDPSTPASLKPYLIDALNNLMQQLFDGGVDTSIPVITPVGVMPSPSEVAAIAEVPTPGAAFTPIVEAPAAESAPAVVQIIININAEQLQAISPSPVSVVPVPEAVVPTPVAIVEQPEIESPAAPSPVEVIEAPTPVNPIDVIAITPPEVISPIDVIDVPTPVNPIDVIAITPPEVISPIDVIDVPTPVNPIDVIAITPPEVISPVDVIDVPTPVNPIDVIAIAPPEINPIDVIAIAAPEINPIDVIAPIPAVSGGNEGILV